jgi:hypothetical protein
MSERAGRGRDIRKGWKRRNVRKIIARGRDIRRAGGDGMSGG